MFDENVFSDLTNGQKPGSFLIPPPLADSDLATINEKRSGQGKFNDEYLGEKQISTRNQAILYKPFKISDIPDVKKDPMADIK